MSSDVALRAAPRDRLLGELLLEANLLGEADLERGLALHFPMLVAACHPRSVTSETIASAMVAGSRSSVRAEEYVGSLRAVGAPPVGRALAAWRARARTRFARSLTDSSVTFTPERSHHCLQRI